MGFAVSRVEFSSCDCRASLDVATVITESLEATSGGDPGRPCAQGELIPKLNQNCLGFCAAILKICSDGSCVASVWLPVSLPNP